MLRVALSLSLLAVGGGVTAADGPPPFVKVALEIGKVGGGSPAVVKDVLVGEVPGIRASLVSLGPGGAARRGPEQRGRQGVPRARGPRRRGGRRHAAPRRPADDRAAAAGSRRGDRGRRGLDARRAGPAPRAERRGPQGPRRAPGEPGAPVRAEVLGVPDLRRGDQEREDHGRTLLPKDIVPRMSIGTVETVGPDRVAPHAHPMLEQLFLGLEGNDIVVRADGGQRRSARTSSSTSRSARATGRKWPRERSCTTCGWTSSATARACAGWRRTSRTSRRSSPEPALDRLHPAWWPLWPKGALMHKSLVRSVLVLAGTAVVGVRRARPAGQGRCP